jgi:hypothetical protein
MIRFAGNHYEGAMFMRKHLIKDIVVFFCMILLVSILLGIFMKDFSFVLRPTYLIMVFVGSVIVLAASASEYNRKKREKTLASEKMRDSSAVGYYGSQDKSSHINGLALTIARLWPDRSVDSLAHMMTKSLIRVSLQFWGISIILSVSVGIVEGSFHLLQKPHYWFLLLVNFLVLALLTLFDCTKK